MAKKILSPIQLARRVTLGALLVGLTIMTILHQRMQGIPSIDALCPFGGLETLYNYLAGGTLIRKIEPGNIVMLGGIVALGVVLSRFFCGWFCAFGALQGIFSWLGKKLFRRSFTVPSGLDRVLRWVKYPVLVGILWLTWRTGELVIRPYDPVAAFGHLSAGLGAVWAEFAVGFVILVLSLGLSMLYERAFCKYICPLGAFNAILGRIPLFRIKRDQPTCITCSRCDKACPMNIDVMKPITVGSPECISCMECVTVCPTKKDTLYLTLAGRKVRLWTVVLLGFAIFAGSAIVGQAADMLRFTAPSLKSLASGGTLAVEDIKGSSTYTNVSESFGIELERLYREAGVSMKDVPADTMIKDTGKLIGKPDFETDEIRSVVARILGVPYSGEHETAEAVMSAAPAVPAASVPIEGSGSGTFNVPAGFELEGMMSVKDVASALNTSTDAVIRKLGLPADIPLDKPLRDLKDSYGFSMPGIKELIKK
jgi:ferredoxin